MPDQFAQALTAAVQAKVNELGWGAGGDNTDLAEYIILMLSSGKDQGSIATELATDLLGLDANDVDAHNFAAWLFGQVSHLEQQETGVPKISTLPSAPSLSTDTPGQAASVAMTGISTDTSMSVDMNADPNGQSRTEFVAPTGPRSMRNGNNPRAGRDKRMLGQINRTLDRPHESVLHRVRGNGNERINSHTRGLHAGPRANNNRVPRSMNNRAASIAHGISTQGVNDMNVNMNSHSQHLQGPQGMGMNGSLWTMQNPPHQGTASQDPSQMQMVAMIEQQSRLIQQLHHQQQLLMKNQGSSGNQRGRGGFGGRANHRNGNARGGRGDHGKSNGRYTPASQDHIMQADGDSEDVDMLQSKRENGNTEETVCKYNLRCTNKDCKFAHQSPAAPSGITIDPSDVCSFGVACKNKKCVGCHPSPAAKAAHQSEQDCRFYPNCTNPNCPFRHPPPPCRNGGDCTVPNCKFTHLDTMCKYRPCTNRFCKFKHEEGQRGIFQDKVWVAENDENKEHVSERKFVDESAGEEMVIPEDDGQDHDVALEAIS